MRIFISADIEGVAGVVSPQQGQPGSPEYERARRLMTHEVNAAIAGAFDGGATAVLVNDSHGPMTNLLPDELDPRAECVLGRPKPGFMAAGLDAGFAAMFMTGYHSGADRHGVLSHTVSGLAFLSLRVNGIDCAEATLYGAYAGGMGIPVALLTGDDQLEAAMRAAVPRRLLGGGEARARPPRRPRPVAAGSPRTHPCRRGKRGARTVGLHALRHPRSLPAGSGPRQRRHGGPVRHHPGRHPHRPARRGLRRRLDAPGDRLDRRHVAPVLDAAPVRWSRVLLNGLAALISLVMVVVMNAGRDRRQQGIDRHKQPSMLMVPSLMAGQDRGEHHHPQPR